MKQTISKVQNENRKLEAELKTFVVIIMLITIIGNFFPTLHFRTYSELNAKSEELFQCHNDLQQLSNKHNGNNNIQCQYLYPKKKS